eukprot:1191082-Prorocentrum_minimum.AAC.5
MATPPHSPQRQQVTLNHLVDAKGTSVGAKHARAGEPRRHRGDLRPGEGGGLLDPAAAVHPAGAADHIRGLQARHGPGGAPAQSGDAQP